MQKVINIIDLLIVPVLAIVNINAETVGASIDIAERVILLLFHAASLVLTCVMIFKHRGHTRSLLTFLNKLLKSKPDE